jgi:hypothetical protein
VLVTVKGLELELKGVELSIVEDKEIKERMKDLNEELRWLKEMDAKGNGDGQVANGRDTRGREGDNGEMGSDETHKRYIRRGNKWRWPVVEEDTSSKDSDSDFHPTHAITLLNSTQPLSKRRKVNAVRKIKTHKPSPAPSDEQTRQRASSPHQRLITTPGVTPPTLSAAQLLSSLKLAIFDAKQFATDIDNIEEEDSDLKEKMERLRVINLEVEERVKQNDKDMRESAGRLV